MTALILSPLLPLARNSSLAQWVNLCFDKLRTEKSRQSLSATAWDEMEDKDLLVCVGCKTRITARSLIVEIQGSEYHINTNPLGVTFTLRCFSQAWHLTPQGPATDEDSWFPGYYWKIACCSGCGNHLGWIYHNASEYFFGLINDKLVDLTQ